jgi:hypothetical protein
MNNTEMTKFSSKFADSISKLYKIGGLGLVFIFIGTLTMIIGFLFPTRSFSIPMFALGGLLLIVSFVLFIIIQYNGPIKTRRLLKENEELLDSIQELSLRLIKLTYNLQSYCFKNIEKITTVIDSISPLVKPFLGDKAQKVVVKMESISKGIVEYSEETEKIISEVQTAIENGDFKKLKHYSDEITNLNDKIKTAIKENI